MPIEDFEFENEVRRIARALWPVAQYQGATIEDAKERDGVFITDECVHLIECTVSRSQSKAKEDISKLTSLADKMRCRYSAKAVKCWFVTLNEPTADQRAISDKHAPLVSALSLNQFRSKLIDAAAYLECRKNYRYGSMQDLDFASATKDFQFVELDIYTDFGDRYAIYEIVEGLLESKRFVLLGDYGAGKSTTLREVFLNLQSKFLRNKSTKFPILLNLRDHYGQKNAAEALERHARNVGYHSPHHLVKAWRGGYTTILLDGFDEMAIAGWSGQASRLKKLRYDSMQLVREFIKDTPDQSGVIVSGRKNYFDSASELRKALGIDSRFTLLNLNDFTDEQVKDYLKKKGWTEAIPAWLPSRPLLLGYLASRGLLKQTVSMTKGLTPAAGWDALLTRICNREAEIEVGLDGETIRRLIENLASKARKDLDGLGPIPPDEVIKSFQEVCGFPPDDRSAVLIQRLPGLGIPNSEDGSRSFIDTSLADAAKAGDVVRFIENPYSIEIESAPDWQSTMNSLGRQVAAYQCGERNLNSGRVMLAIQQAAKKRETAALCADIVQVSQELDFGCPTNTYIRGVFVSDITLGEFDKDYSCVEYQDCVFQYINLAMDVNEALLPRFVRCSFGSVDGRVSETDMPKDIFVECSYESFSKSSETSAAIMSLGLPLGVRVTLVVLKKLYLQAGAGRKDSALYRGLDQRAREVVPSVLQLLKRENLVLETKSSGNTLWIPVRAQGARVKRLISAPNSSTDSLIVHASSLT